MPITLRAWNGKISALRTGKSLKHGMAGRCQFDHALLVQQLKHLVSRWLVLGLAACSGWGALGATPPNIVYILCDDLGYGDVRCLNPQGKIPTPHMDLGDHRWTVEAFALLRMA